MNSYIDNEKHIQSDIQRKIELQLGHSISDETLLPFRKNTDKAEHPYILYNEFIEALIRLNPAIFRRSDIKHTESEICNKIWFEFVHAYDTCPTDQLYDFIFNQTHKVCLNMKNNTIVEFKYFILDKGILTNECSKNKITIIKEKCLKALVYGYSDEYPDFALYCNGLPFIVMEVKNPMRTNPLIEAYSDYRSKTTYHKFLGCILTDGKKMAFVASPRVEGFDIWRNYGANKTNEDANGLYDFIDEFFFNPKNLMTLFMFGFFRNNNNILTCSRVQQYFVMKKIIAKLSSNMHLNIPIRSLIKHPPRSGKTITSRSIIHIITELFPDRFDKIIIQLPDKTITKQFTNNFCNYEFKNNMVVREIECKSKNSNGKFSYEDAITTKARGIYIMNMQKTDDTYFTSIASSSDKVLFILDEVHTHQNSTMAEDRTKQFPNASYITFTATPRVKNGIDISHLKYSDSSEGYLDELTNESAMGLDIVLPIIYKKAGYDLHRNIPKLKEYAETLRERLRLILLNDPGLYEELDKKVARINKNRNDFDILVDEINIYSHALDNSYDDMIEQQIRKNIPLSINSFFNIISRESILSRITFITNFIKMNPYSFKAKAFWVVDSKEDALVLMHWILEQTGSNVYNGFKFGADFSCDANEWEKLKHFNNVDKQEDIIAGLSSTDNDSIDIIILVAKYLKGYDNKELCYVFCDTIIQEPTKIYQLYTRPGTKRDYKKYGFFVDMCSFDTNYKTFESAVAYYEKHEKIFSLVVTDEIIEAVKHDIYHNGILLIADMFRLNLDDFRSALRHNPYLFSTLDIEQRAEIYEACIKINNYCRRLICFEKYGPDLFLDVLMISRAFIRLQYDSAQKQRRFFSKEQHIAISRELMDRLGYDNAQEILNVELNGDIYERHIEIESNKNDYLTKEMRINVNSNHNNYYGDNDFIDSIVKKTVDIECSNWGDSVNENTRLKDWYQSISRIQHIPEFEVNKEEWEKIYDFLNMQIKKQRDTGHIRPGERIAENILHKIRHELLSLLDENNLISYEDIFDDDNEINGQKIINLSIGHIIG